jgi:ABC-type oligopeptide transport system ATPase subunit
MEPVIAVKDLRKVYKAKGKGHAAEVKAIDGVTFEVGRGEFFGLLDRTARARRQRLVS